jgi:dCTP deaminase
MPIHKLGLAQLRSSWAMLGLIIPPTIIDPGFYGHLTIEVFNSAPMPIILRPGDVVFSIAIVNAEDVPIYNGKYQGQIGIRKPVALKRT